MATKVEAETISPAMAKRYLQFNTQNRNLKNEHVLRLAEDMRQGRWTTCLAPIAFYEDQSVADGQHRLEAVALSGRSQRFFVVRGVKRAEGLNIDTGIPRSIVDAAKISGLDPTLNHRLVAAARAIEDGDHGSSARAKQRSNADRLALVTKHRQAAEWAIARMGSHKLTNALTLGAVGRAWYWEKDVERLARYCAVLTQGFAAGRDEDAAVAMRNYLIERGPTSMLHSTWRDTFLKAQNSIHYFMKGKSLQVIKGVANEQYPLKP